MPQLEASAASLIGIRIVVNENAFRDRSVQSRVRVIVERCSLSLAAGRCILTLAIRDLID
jgi:hypothetical protein